MSAATVRIEATNSGKPPREEDCDVFLGGTEHRAYLKFDGDDEPSVSAFVVSADTPDDDGWHLQLFVLRRVSEEDWATYAAETWTVRFTG